MHTSLFQHCDEGVQVHRRNDGGLFNLARLKSPTIARSALVQEQVFADNCGILVHTVADGSFCQSYQESWADNRPEKTEVLYQATPKEDIALHVLVQNERLKVTDSFTDIGAVVLSDGALDNIIDDHIARPVSLSTDSKNECGTVMTSVSRQNLRFCLLFCSATKRG